MAGPLTASSGAPAVESFFGRSLGKLAVVAAAPAAASARAQLLLLCAGVAVVPATGCQEVAPNAAPAAGASVTAASEGATPPLASAIPSGSTAAPGASSASGRGSRPTPEGMVYVEPAVFDAVMGDGRVARTEVRGFFIDKEKVTNGAFKRCHEARACVVSWGSLDFLKPHLANGPITGMSQGEARAFCKSVGKRLPTDPEWELAARGREGRRYPWGDEAPADCAPPACKPVRMQTPEGLIGMAGVLWEMSDAEACFVKTARPELCTQKAPVVHGGAWNTSAKSFESLAVHNASGVPYSTVSFRCVKDAD